MKLIITGNRGIGKSTLRKKITDYLNNFHLCGFYTKVVNKENNSYVTLKIIDGEHEIIIGEYKDKMTPVIEGFKQSASELEKLDSTGKFLVIDELGFLESNFLSFQNQVFRLINTSKHFIIVIRKMNTDFLNRIKKLEGSNLIEVTADNRDMLAEIIDKFI